MKSYKDLEIYKMAFDLAYEINQMTKRLPKYELYEQGSQLRRSSQSVKDNIVEGYGRRRYKAEFIRYLIFAQSSNDEALNQLYMINLLYFQKDPIDDLISRCEILGRKINRFLQFVEKNWQTSKCQFMI